LAIVSKNVISLKFNIESMISVKRRRFDVPLKRKLLKLQYADFVDNVVRWLKLVFFDVYTTDHSFFHGI